ncbi:hypothetical protein D3C87_2008380 [compost metagenome]
MRNGVCETYNEYGSGFHIDGHRADFPQVFLEAVVVLPDAAVGGINRAGPVIELLLFNGGRNGTLQTEGR